MSGMRVYVGIDLGSTTTKAVILDDDEQVVGRGITNSRSNYDVACAIVRDEAFVRARFSMTGERMRRDPALGARQRPLPAAAGAPLPPAAAPRPARQPAEVDARRCRQLRATAPTTRSWLTSFEEIVDRMTERAQQHFGEGAARKSDFFRDIAAADYMHLAEERGESRRESRSRSSARCSTPPSWSWRTRSKRTHSTRTSVRRWIRRWQSRPLWRRHSCLRPPTPTPSPAPSTTSAPSS